MQCTLSWQMSSLFTWWLNTTGNCLREMQVNFPDSRRKRRMYLSEERNFTYLWKMWSSSWKIWYCWRTPTIEFTSTDSFLKAWKSETCSWTKSKKADFEGGWCGQQLVLINGGKSTGNQLGESRKISLVWLQFLRHHPPTDPLRYESKLNLDFSRFLVGFAFIWFHDLLFCDQRDGHASALLNTCTFSWLMWVFTHGLTLFYLVTRLQEVHWFHKKPYFLFSHMKASSDLTLLLLQILSSSTLFTKWF